MSVVTIGRETSPNNLTHGHATAGSAPSRLTELSNLPCLKGVLLRCPGANDPGGGNTAPVWIGSLEVTADSDPGTGGMPLLPGGTIVIPASDPSMIFVISTADGQDVAWMIL